MTDPSCDCPECRTGAPNDNEEHRRRAALVRNGEIAAEISEQVRLGLMDPEEARDKVRRMGR